jgi:hypothetical protein
MYKRQQAAAASKVLPQMGLDAAPQVAQLVDAATLPIEGADGAMLCVPATNQVRVLDV